MWLGFVSMVRNQSQSLPEHRILFDLWMEKYEVKHGLRLNSFIKLEVFYSLKYTNWESLKGKNKSK